MAKYLDEAGLSTLWTKIKGTFVAQTIKKSSDSTNATQITHDGETVSLSSGFMSGSTYAKVSSIDINNSNIILTSTSRPIYRVDSESTPVNLVLSSDTATSSTYGIVKLGSDTVQTTAANSVTSTSSRTYAVQKNNSGQLVVNVPWTDTNTTYSEATSLALGLVKLGNDTVQTTATNSVTSTSSRTYAVQKNSSSQLVVNVPWTDTKITVDSALNSTSTNPVQNKVIYTALSTTDANVSTNAGNITTLQGYFTKGKADYAINDENGNSIKDTYATKTELSAKANASDFNDFTNLGGQPNGWAELDSTGKVPSSQLPSYVDDVIEGYYYNSKFYKEDSHTTEITGESGKIYTDIETNKTYRWSGTTYTEISASLALGTTSSTAYRGDLGAANAANIETLQSYFDNEGSALYAVNDEDGHSIIATYATKTELSAKANLSGGNSFSGDQSITGALNITASSGAGKIVIKGASGNHPGGVTFQTSATSSTTANTITIPAKTGTMALTSDLPTLATTTNLGLVKSSTTGTTANRDYNVQVNSDGTMKVNVPWTDTNTTYSAATASSLGLVKSSTTGTTANRDYNVQVNSDGTMKVNVPWTDTNTTYSNATTSTSGLMSAADKTKLDGFEGAIPDSTINALS